ncbi:MAG TPA: NUDIX domain-containing protein [Allosphingosinicella sp.]|nr:NUDIX domain-containing protein [Allosphingosinicella sp.]
MPRPIRIAAALIEDPEGRLLLVRKRGTVCFMQAGGKIEDGETPFEALARELREELGFAPEPEQARLIGHFSARAANEPGHRVEAELYRIRAANEQFVLGAELDEMLWVTPAAARALPLAPLTRDCVLPLAVSNSTPAPFDQKW